jgi:hypothetical protein
MVGVRRLAHLMRKIYDPYSTGPFGKAVDVTGVDAESPEAFDHRIGLTVQGTVSRETREIRQIAGCRPINPGEVLHSRER